MNPVQIQAIIQLVITIGQGLAQIWNSLDPETRKKITNALKSSYDKIPEIIQKLKEGEKIPLDDLYLEKSVVDVLKELQEKDKDNF